MGSLNAKAALWTILCRWLQPIGELEMKTIYLSRVIASVGSLILTFTNPASAAPMQILAGHVPAAAESVQPAGFFPATNHLRLAIGLPLRNQAALSNLLRQIYDPASPNYHHYLTPEQFAEQFGPAEADYQAVVAFANANGLRVTATHPNRVLLDVDAPVANVERAFHVTMRTYQHPVENRTFYAPDAEPSLDLIVPILHISGLNDYSLPRPRFVTKPLADSQNELPNADTGSGPAGTFMGNDFRAAYAPDTTLTGSGQVVGLLQFDGYSASDIAYYESQAGLPNVPLQNVLIDGASGAPSGTSGQVEVSLDIEMAISMAPGLSQIIVYEAPNFSPFVDLLNRMATDNLAKQLSCSWYVPNGTAEPAADVIFQEMAAQGQTFFNASGDGDAYTGLIDFPGDTPFITQVGGTTLTTSGPGGARVSETVWNWGGGIGSSGGVSTQYPIPSWQTNISMAANQGSTTMRNTPDVAMTADNVYVRAIGHNYVNVGGTSCSAPLWAGFMALVNQQAVAAGQPPVGFLNPLLDTIGSEANYASAFHDIAAGNNTWSGSPAKFCAVTGYDLCTGWGTPAGQRLIDALANPEALIITPPTGFTSTGGFGGPFTITSLDLVLTNVGTNSLTWTLANTSAWLNVSSSGGTLAPGGAAATVTVSLNTAASNLVAGIYSATVWFTNLNDNAGQSRLFTLNVISPPMITTQPTNQAVLEGATASFTVAATGGLPLAYQWQDNGTNLADGGKISGSTTTNLVISSVSFNNIGTYTVIVTNIAGSTISSNALLTIIPSAPVIILQPSNQTAVVGSTATFSVSADGTTPLSYQWSYNRTNITDATNVSLTLANVQLAQVGIYAVVVTNIYGSETSSNATLDVYAIPVITSFSPQSGAMGTVVNINGLSFDPTPTNNLVYFGGVRAVVSAASTTNLVVTVPPGATYKSISETVKGLTAYSPMPFLPTFPSAGILTNSSLGPQISLPSLSGIGDIVFADIDGDGKPDLVMLSGYGPVVSVYRNISTNDTLNTDSFAPRVDLPLGNNMSGVTAWVTVADVNGDGKQDIIVANANTGPTNGTVSIVQNFCTPGNLASNLFGAPVNFPVAVGSFGVVVRDLDGDGKPDIVTANYDSTTISVLRNIGSTGLITTNSFTSAVHFVGAPGTKNVAIADMDGDGKPDVVTVDEVNGGSEAVSVFRNVSTVGNIAFAPRVDFSGLTYCYNLALGDMDGDGKLDVVVSSFAIGQSVSVYRNTSTPGSIAFAPEADFALGGWGNSVTVGDLDGDGKPDVAAVTQSGNALSLFRNISTPGIFTNTSLASRLDFASGSNPYGVAIGDLDGDGRPDIAFANNYGNTISIYQNVIPFGGPPVITMQPTNLLVASGTTATFAVAAAGSTPLSYQWSFNGTNITAATNSALVLTNVQLSQSGNYVVLVTNALGAATSSNAVLMVVSSPPVIVTAPSSVTNIAGTTAAFAVTAGGSLPLNFQWQENGAAMTDGGNVSGPTTSNLVISYVQDTNMAAYTVVVTNVAGCVTSPPALLVVIDPPVIVTQPTNLTVSAGATASFTVTASGTAPLSYQWLKNDVGMTDGGNVSGSATASLMLTSVSLSDMAGYSVVVINPAGSITSQVATLTVAVAPTITAQPLSSTNVVGATVSFTVTASGTPTLNYQWNFNGANINGATGATLTLTNVQLAQAGNYAVLVTNNYGSLLSSNAVLTVIAPATNVPVITAFSPTSGFIGTSVSIMGLNFSPVSGNNVVYFGGVQAPVITASATNLVVTVPPGATYKSISETVGGLTAYSPMPFLPTFPSAGILTNASLGPQIALGSLSGIGVVVFADMDGDGKPDIVTFSGYGPTVSIYRNISTNGTLNAASFAPRVDLPLGNNMSGVTGWMALADIDGDGKLDIVVCNELSGPTNGTVTILQNFCTPGNIASNLFGAPVTFLTAIGPSGVAVKDLDGDGKPDIVTANYDSSTISVLRNIGSTGLITTNSFASAVHFVGASGTRNVAIADLDGDGKPDVVTVDEVNGSTGAVSVFHNVSTLGNITFAARVDYSGPTYCYDIAIGDMDGDGKMDVVVSSFAVGQSASVYRNISTPGSLALASRIDFALGGWGNAVAVGDLDGDAKPDVAAVTQSGSKLSLFRNMSTPGSFTSGSLAARLDFASGSNPYGVTIGDLDGDGRPDIAFANNYNNYLSIYQNVIGAKPFIVLQPSSQTNLVGTTATFTVVSSGSTPLTYQWKMKGTNIIGATGTNFIIVSVQATNAGIYSVAITNAYGSVISSNAVLTVLVPPTIILAPASRTNVAGSTATFTSAASGTLPLNYFWQKNGVDLSDGGNVSGSATTNLSLSNVQDADGANYALVVTNMAGSITSSPALLVVLDPPSILLQPTNLTVLRSSNAVFSVMAGGSMPLSYQWSFNGTNLFAATNAVLTLTNVQLNQAGLYAAMVTNNSGSITSSNAVLVVNPLFHFIWNQIPSPRFATAPFTVTVQALNPTNGLAADFIETVSFLSTNAVPVAPPVSGNFIQGVWTGAVTINQTFTNLVLEAMDSYGESGLANPINVISLPSLATASSAGSLYIFWPVNPSGFVLETTPGLSPANWVPIAAPPLQFGGQNVQPIQMSETNAFYRLRFTGQ
jgi:hypothetical protein